MAVTTTIKNDGIDALVPHDQMTESARKLRDTYAVTPGVSFYRCEFGFMRLESWKQEGMPEDVDRAEHFQLDPPGKFNLNQLGWTVAAFEPPFEEIVTEDRGDCEVVQDRAGRHVLFFKGRRNGYMPEYLDNPVKDKRTWEENVKWRLQSKTPTRYEDLEERMDKAKTAAGEGRMITQRLIGGYMYLRSLMGTENLLYTFHDNPELIHDCMQQWFELADAVIGQHQQFVTLDELFLAEDICYCAGPLISPDMMREFLFPYYQQLIRNIRTRQIDRSRNLYIQIDTDGFAESVIPLYQEIGMTAMSPFEVAAGCDVVRAGRDFPELAIFGGIDKRMLAQTKVDIDRELERILPVMRERGGYIPTCDHMVPEEVPYENYLHYRKRCVELGGDLK